MNNNIAPAEIIRILGGRFRDYRMRLSMTQKDVSELTALSLPTISKFESGRSTDISASALFKLLHAVGVDAAWDLLLPDLPESPYLYDDLKKRQRIRHRRP